MRLDAGRHCGARCAHAERQHGKRRNAHRSLCSALCVCVLRAPSALCFSEHLFPTYPVAIAYLCVVTLSYAHFVVLTINQICDFLHIKCFTIVPKLQAQ